MTIDEIAQQLNEGVGMACPCTRANAKGPVTPRVENSRVLTSDLGIKPSERSNGGKGKRGGITKAGLPIHCTPLSWRLAREPLWGFVTGRNGLTIATRTRCSAWCWRTGLDKGFFAHYAD